MSKNDDPFIAYILQRKAVLEDELRRLNAALDVYQKSGVQMVPAQGALPIEDEKTGNEKKKLVPTIKKMILDILEHEGDNGLEALEILKRINEKWETQYDRTSLSPQLSRLKQEGRIWNRAKIWRIRNENSKHVENH